MIPGALLNQTVSIKRRTSTGTDTLGNPIYGTPTGGAGWNIVYKTMPARLAFSSKLIRFAPEGERIQPSGTMYYNPAFNLRAEDRVLTTDAAQNAIEYVVISVVPGITFGGVVSHYEAILQLP